MSVYKVILISNVFEWCLVGESRQDQIRLKQFDLDLLSDLMTTVDDVTC